MTRYTVVAGVLDREIMRLKQTIEALGINPGDLEEASYIYLLPDGRYLLSTDFVPYGIAPGAQAADLLAWREGEDWHVKRLEVERT